MYSLVIKGSVREAHVAATRHRLHLLRATKHEIFNQTHCFVEAPADTITKWFFEQDHGNPSLAHSYPVGTLLVYSPTPEDVVQRLTPPPGERFYLGGGYSIYRDDHEGSCILVKDGEKLWTGMTSALLRACTSPDQDGFESAIEFSEWQNSRQLAEDEEGNSVYVYGPGRNVIVRTPADSAENGRFYLEWPGRKARYSNDLMLLELDLFRAARAENLL